MRYQTSTIKRKLILGGVLLTLLSILLPLGPVLAQTAGAPLTMNETLTYEADGLFILNFTAEKSFEVEWYDLMGGQCHQMPHWGYRKIIIYTGDFSGTHKAGLIINKENLSIFKDAGDCAVTEYYTAGNSYTAYLVDENHLIVKTDTVETIKADRLRDLDEEGNIDAESVIALQQEDEGTWYAIDLGLIYPPTLNILLPTDGSELSSAFEMSVEFDYAESFERVMITFEDWDASSTCPSYGTEAWDTEYPLYFNYQSLPYFSPLIATSTGTTTIAVSDLAARNYKCVRCYFILESTGGISDELCPDYNINVLAYIPPSDLPIWYLPVTDWESYYTEHSERFATSTPLFLFWADTFEPLIVWVGNTAIFFQDYFDVNVAQARGEEMGNAVATARGYLKPIDDFFGGMPLSTVFIFYLITALVIIVYRIVKGILTIIIP